LALGVQPENLIVGLSVFSPFTPTRSVLDRNVERTLRIGVRGFSFYNYGIMPARNLDWVRSAVDAIRCAP